MFKCLPDQRIGAQGFFECNALGGGVPACVSEVGFHATLRVRVMLVGLSYPG
jgi:hypothetical protein